MRHCKKILRELGRQLCNDYCPAAGAVVPFGQAWCRDCLAPAISEYWKFKYERLCGERTFADAFNGTQCSSAMREILAIFHYAKTDAAVAALMPRLFLDLEGKERLTHTPYWNRFVEEYKKQRKQRAPKPVPLPDLIYTLGTLKPEDFKTVEETIKKLKRKGRK